MPITPEAIREQVKQPQYEAEQVVFLLKELSRHGWEHVAFVAGLQDAIGSAQMVLDRLLKVRDEAKSWDFAGE